MAAAVDSDKANNTFAFNDGSEVPVVGDVLKTEEAKTEVEPPVVLPLQSEDDNSDTDTLVGEEGIEEICKEMEEYFEKFSNFARNFGSLPEELHEQPLWKAGQLPTATTPVARPVPAYPANVIFCTAQPETPKPVIIADPLPPVGKSINTSKKAKKATAAAEDTKLDILRNPMFHSNLPPVQITRQPVQRMQGPIGIPDPIPIPPNVCQAMMRQQSVRTQSFQPNPMYGQQYNYVNPNHYNPVPPNPPTQYMEQATAPPKPDNYQTRMNLATFTQKNDERYSLFKTPDDNQQRSFLPPEYYENQKPVILSNPIGTQPGGRPALRTFGSDSSLFTNPIQRSGTTLKQEYRVEYTSLYTPFGQKDTSVFRNALFGDKNESSKVHVSNEKLKFSHVIHADTMPYFQRLRVRSKLNSEVTESNFYKSLEPGLPLKCGMQGEESLFSRPPPGYAWTDHLYGPPRPNETGVQSARSSPTGSSAQPGCSPHGAASTPTSRSARSSAGASVPSVRAPARCSNTEPNVLLPDSSITDLTCLDDTEREIESFKRFEFYFKPPQHKPKVQLDCRYIASALKRNHK